MRKYKLVAAACALALALSLTGCGKSKDSDSSGGSSSSNSIPVASVTNPGGEFGAIAGTWEDNAGNKVIIRTDGKLLILNGNEEVTDEGICAYDESDRQIINFNYTDGEKNFSIETDGTENITSFESNKTGKTFNRTANADYSFDLPEYKYNGSDKYLGAITEYCLKESTSYMDAETFIPVPEVFKVDESDSNDIKVTGIFWVLGYDIYNDILYDCAGYKMCGIIHLKQNGSTYEVTNAEFARDGVEYEEDIKKFCNGDAELEKKFSDDQGEFDEVRKAEVKSYVEANGLNIIGFQDYGWPTYKLD